MKFELLNKNSNIAIIIAGIISIFIGVGIARFSFTSLLPLMLNDFLTIKLVSFLASVNYIGYLIGSIVAIFIKDIYTRIQFFRLGLILSIISTIILGITINEVLWTISRIIAGFSIVIVDLIIKIININNNLWQFSWLILTIFATIFSIYPIYIFSLDKKINNQNINHKIEKHIFTPFVIILIIAYFCEGVGFVVQATFLPDIINKLQGLEGFGSLTWLFVGIAGIPASIIWMKLAYKFGSTNIIIYALFIQIIGILIPTITNNIYLNILSGVLYGGTFIGLSALFMNLVGKLSGKNPVVLMGTITTSYSIGMIVAPLYCVALYEKFNSHKYSLYLTALIVFLGLLLLIYAKKKQIVKE